jgi:Fe-S cluster assembly protein SufD
MNVLENTNIKDIYIADFESVMSLHENTALINDTTRRQAIVRFSELGFPTTKNEEWKYTSLKPVLTHKFKHSSPGDAFKLRKQDVIPFHIAGADANVLVFENGRFNSELSHINAESGIIIDSIDNHLSHPLFVQYFAKYADYTNEALVALNTAFALDGAFVHVPNNKVVEKPIHLMFVNDSREDKFVAYPRNLVVCGKNSKVTLVESFHSVGNNHSFTNAVTEIIADENANVDLYKIQVENEKAYQVSNTQVDQEASSNCSVHTVTLSGAIVRNNLSYLLNGTNCETHMYGLYILSGNQLVDNHTLVDHAKPHCYSNELYKGIMDDNSIGVFNGKVMVRPDAQKTNAYQSNSNILLSDDATINTKPQLEIYADDVKCSHGATTGQLDNESLFYLRSRGIGEEKARMMLMFAFASDIINNIKIDALKENLMGLLAERLKQEEI